MKIVTLILGILFLFTTIACAECEPETDEPEKTASENPNNNQLDNKNNVSMPENDTISLK